MHIKLNPSDYNIIIDKIKTYLYHKTSDPSLSKDQFFIDLKAKLPDSKMICLLDKLLKDLSLETK